MGHSFDIYDLRTQLLVGLGALTAWLIVQFLLKLRAVGFSRSKFYPFQPYGLPGALLPNTWWNASSLYAWEGRNTIYKDRETFTLVPFLTGPPMLFTSSIEVTRQVTAHKAPFDKNKLYLQGLRPFGDNLVTELSHGEWSRHRRVVNPAFNQELYRLVWASSVRTFKDMTASERWDLKDTVDIANIGDLVGKFALLIITDVGFGMPLSWNEPPGSSEDGMTLLEAFEVMTRNLMLTLVTPKWATNLPIKELQRTKQSHEKIFSVMREFVQDRRAQLGNKTEAEKTQESRTILNLLLDANDHEGKGVLNDQELFSNVFVMLFAGHETSAKTMAATLGMLAIHPEEQEKVYAHVRKLLAGGRDPTFDDFDALRPVQACLMEALRLFPTGALIIRQPTEDTVLRPEGEQPPVFVSTKTLIVCDVTGINYNPRYYPDPNAFIPSRWTDTKEPEYFSFGAGPRACIGRKFAMFEMTCFLALFLRDWKVEPIYRLGETSQGWRKRVLEDTVTLTVTMGPDMVPVRIIRRS
ncbi:cytochrome P450 [Calocera viscosa TUFC12733]|uniref:Cytochrome P450 n=1 Tax=Calocera viscosa (strain TUFC12733) TaxID=1330018 RepID=A0A167H455_CALVF|nr:cytochrome P450 [Calocera viscosa TUFC12733]